MFEIDDYVVYSGKGICKIDDIGVPMIDGIDKSKTYYIMRPVFEKNATFYVKVDCDKPMRRMLSKGEAENILDEIPSLETNWQDNDKAREEIYKNVLKNCDCYEYLKMLKGYNLQREKRKAIGKKMAVMDERYYKKMQDYLYGELSVALSMPKEDVETLVRTKAGVLEQ